MRKPEASAAARSTELHPAPLFAEPDSLFVTGAANPYRPLRVYGFFSFFTLSLSLLVTNAAILFATCMLLLSSLEFTL